MLIFKSADPSASDLGRCECCRVCTSLHFLCKSELLPCIVWDQLALGRLDKQGLGLDRHFQVLKEKT